MSDLINPFDLKRRLRMVIASVFIVATILDLPSTSTAQINAQDFNLNQHQPVHNVPELCQDVITIAVLELDALNIPPSDAQAITERLRARLTTEDVFRVIERHKMNLVLEEQGFQLSGTCDSNECVVEVGKLLGTQKMIAGSVSKVGQIYTLQVRVVDVQNGRIEYVADDDEAGIEELLTTSTSKVSYELASAYRSPEYQYQPTVTHLPGFLHHSGWYIRFQYGPTKLLSLAEIEEEYIQINQNYSAFNSSSGQGASILETESSLKAARRIYFASDFESGRSFTMIIGRAIDQDLVLCIRYATARWPYRYDSNGHYIAQDTGLGLIKCLMPGNIYLGGFIVGTHTVLKLGGESWEETDGIGFSIISGKEFHLFKGIHAGVGTELLWASNAAGWNVTISLGWDYPFH